MNIRFYHRLWLALTTIILSVSIMQAQMSSEFWITVQSDSSTRCCPPWKLWFGNHINGTYGIDSLNPTLREIKFPALAPGFAAAWGAIPGRPNIWGEIGKLYRYDFRGIPSNNISLDTFLLFFSDIYVDADITIRWPKAEYLAQRCDSMFLVDWTGQIPKINAFIVDSVIIIDAMDKNIFRFLIYKYGCKIIDDVESESNLIIENYSLHQNYPNPFNPTTSIKYQLPFNSQVKLKIYNVLGQTIALLSDEIQQAGFKSATWNANDAASGIYFYKLEAVSMSDPSKIFMQVKKMVLVR